ncbi:MAG: hypothetical protein AAB444_02760 [Patescibacteria group bacterium]
MHAPRRVLTFLLPVLTFLAFEAVFRRPAWVLWILPVLLIILLAAIFFILGRGLKTPSSRWNFCIGPAVFYLCAFATVFLIEEAFARHALAVAGAILIGLFFESIYTYIWEHEWYEAYSLENISGYLNSISAFLAGSAFLGMEVFLQVPRWMMLEFVVLVYGLLTWQAFWIARIPWSSGKYFVAVITLILAEFFFAFSTLPAHYLISGAALGVLWYTFISLSRAHHLGFLTRGVVVRHLVLSGLLLAALFGSARWF